MKETPWRKGMNKPSRGTSQRDSLFPFFFFFFWRTKGLHGLISQTIIKGDIHGYSMRSQSLTHLLFLDDNLFFADPILKNAKNSWTFYVPMKSAQSNKLMKIRPPFLLANPL